VMTAETNSVGPRHDDDDVSLLNEDPPPTPPPPQYCTDGSKSMFLADESGFMGCEPLKRAIVRIQRCSNNLKDIASETVSWGLRRLFIFHIDC
jgi:hypothetical protein